MQKLRQFLLLKWTGFLPLPQLSLSILGKQNLSNELKVFLVNNFVKELTQYDFVRHSSEFTSIFDPN